MLNKIAVSALNCVNSVKSSIKEKLTNRNGMELLQMVIIIGIAIAIGGIFFVLMKNYFPTFFNNIISRLNELFDAGKVN